MSSPIAVFSGGEYQYTIPGDLRMPILIFDLDPHDRTSWADLRTITNRSFADWAREHLEDAGLKITVRNPFYDSTCTEIAIRPKYLPAIRERRP